MSRKVIFSLLLSAGEGLIINVFGSHPWSHNRRGALQTAHSCASGPLQHKIHNFIRQVSAEEKYLFLVLKGQFAFSYFTWPHIITSVIN